MVKKSKADEKQMESLPVSKLILRLSIPTTLAMLVNSAYSIADAFFVARVGFSATGAVGIGFSIICLIQAIGFTLGSGGGSLISRALGAKNEEEAGEFSALSFWLSLIIGTVVAILGLCFLNPLIRFLGATKTIFPYARSYALWLLVATPLLCGGFVLSYLLRARGNVVLSMVGLSVGFLLNILLDPLLILRFQLGTAGASLATLISQGIGFIVLLISFLKSSPPHSLSPKKALGAIKRFGAIFYAGLPSLFRQGFAGVASILLTRAAANFGDSAVGAVSVVSRIFLLLFGFCLGIGQGMMPAAGYNQGRKDEKRVLEIYRFSLFLSTGVLALLSIFSFIFAPFWISLFRNDPEIVSLGTTALRWQSAVACLHGTITTTNMLLQSIGKPFPAAIMALSRQGLFLIPLVFILPVHFGLPGLLATQATADICTFLFSLPFAVWIYKLLKKKAPQPTV